MVGGELGGRDAATAAVRSDLVVVPSPLADHLASLRQRGEPVLVEALVAELAVEALDVAVLHRAARLDQQVFDAVALRPGDKDPAGELRTVVGANRPGIAPETGGLVQHAHDIGAADAVIDGDVDGLVREVVGHGQALETAAAGQRVTDEVVPLRLAARGSVRSQASGRSSPLSLSRGERVR